MLRQLLLLVHVFGAIAWIGGMFFAHFCLRPAAIETLDPPQRLPLMAATFSRFLNYMAIAVVGILATGMIMLAQTGFAAAPFGWHVMLATGLVMAGVFAWIYAVLFPQLRASSAAAAWPAAAKTLDRMRQLVMVNLALGVVTVIAAISAR